jgi:hypothetical protein
LTDTAFVCAAGPFVAESVNSVIVFILFPVGRWLRQEALASPKNAARIAKPKTLQACYLRETG